MNQKVKIAFIILSILLLMSSAGNVVIYERAQRYYLLLNASHLDPLGLGAFDDTPVNLEQPLVVFFGDSRAANWTAPDQIKSVTFVNRGVGNQTTAQIVGRFQAHVPPLQPQIIVIQAGINDLKTIPLFPDEKESIIRNCKANLKQIVELSTATGAQVVVTTIFPLGKLPVERRPFWSDDVAIAINEVNSFIETLASDQVTIFHTEDVLANSDGIVDPQYSQDFLHLNPTGYAALNEAIYELLAP
ncbi:MAG: SGNH/GDSL hydrolase family protein [Anaerolineales bacterium]|nr:SGNH/GDSL hydrolase family protein [Anaerolineales bacterium]